MVISHPWRCDASVLRSLSGLAVIAANYESRNRSATFQDDYRLIWQLVHAQKRVTVRVQWVADSITFVALI